MMKKNKNVILLGFVSLFTDLSSQMIYPLLPEFLTVLGASNSLIGLISGIIESVAVLFRSIFGRLSDKFKKRKLFILIGYALSSLSKPLLFFAHIWTSVLAVTILDRFGKAIRTPARDALISVSVDSKKTGRAFGFHRAMDRIGAIGGPLLAMLILAMFNNNIRIVFLLSLIPALIAVAIILFVKEITTQKNIKIKAEWNLAISKNKAFIMFLLASIFFSLGNSSNAFLILKAKEVGFTVMLIPLVWVCYNISSAFFSLIFGRLSDKIGRIPLVIVSFIFYGFIYASFAFAYTPWLIWILFIGYGIYYGLSNGIYRAYIADITHPDYRATAYGIYNTAIGITLLPASILMGTLWDIYSSKIAFLCASGFSFIGFLIFIASFQFTVFQKNNYE